MIVRKKLTHPKTVCPSDEEIISNMQYDAKFISKDQILSIKNDCIRLYIWSFKYHFNDIDLELCKLMCKDTQYLNKVIDDIIYSYDSEKDDILSILKYTIGYKEYECDNIKKDLLSQDKIAQIIGTNKVWVSRRSTSFKNKLSSTSTINMLRSHYINNGVSHLDIVGYNNFMKLVNRARCGVNSNILRRCKRPEERLLVCILSYNLYPNLLMTQYVRGLNNYDKIQSAMQNYINDEDLKMFNYYINEDRNGYNANEMRSQVDVAKHFNKNPSTISKHMNDVIRKLNNSKLLNLIK